MFVCNCTDALSQSTIWKHTHNKYETLQHPQEDIQNTLINKEDDHTLITSKPPRQKATL